MQFGDQAALVQQSQTSRNGPLPRNLTSSHSHNSPYKTGIRTQALENSSAKQIKKALSKISQSSKFRMNLMTASHDEAVSIVD